MGPAKALIVREVETGLRLFPLYATKSESRVKAKEETKVGWRGSEEAGKLLDWAGVARSEAARGLLNTAAGRTAGAYISKRNLTTVGLKTWELPVDGGYLGKDYFDYKQRVKELMDTASHMNKQASSVRATRAEKPMQKKKFFRTVSEIVFPRKPLFPIEKTKETKDDLHLPNVLNRNTYSSMSTYRDRFYDIFSKALGIKNNQGKPNQEVKPITFNKQVTSRPFRKTLESKSAPSITVYQHLYGNKPELQQESKQVNLKSNKSDLGISKQMAYSERAMKQDRNPENISTEKKLTHPYVNISKPSSHIKENANHRVSEAFRKRASTPRRHSPVVPRRNVNYFTPSNEMSESKGVHKNYVISTESWNFRKPGSNSNWGGIRSRGEEKRGYPGVRPRTEYSPSASHRDVFRKFYKKLLPDTKPPPKHEDNKEVNSNQAMFKKSSVAKKNEGLQQEPEPRSVSRKNVNYAPHRRKSTTKFLNKEPNEAYTPAQYSTNVTPRDARLKTKNINYQSLESISPHNDKPVYEGNRKPLDGPVSKVCRGAAYSTFVPLKGNSNSTRLKSTKASNTNLQQPKVYQRLYKSTNNGTDISMRKNIVTPKRQMHVQPAQEEVLTELLNLCSSRGGKDQASQKRKQESRVKESCRSLDKKVENENGSKGGILCKLAGFLGGTCEKDRCPKKC